MSVDRGGLQYSINIDGNYRGELSDFRTQIKNAKKDLATLGKERRGGRGSSEGAASARQATSFLKAQTKQIVDVEKALDQMQERTAIAARRREEREERDRSRRLRQALNERLKDEVTNRERISVARQRATERERAAELRSLRQNIEARLNAEVATENKINQAKERAAIARRKIEERENSARIKALRDNIKERSQPTEQDLLRLRAQRDINRVLGEQALIQEKINIIQKQGLKLSEQQAVALGLASRLPGARGGVPAPAPQQKTAKDRILDFLGLANATDKAEKSAGRAEFTFRRLFGVLAAFTIARQAIRGITGLVRDMISFNAAIEQSELGIASLFLAVGQVRDATGQAATASQGLALAQREARRQVELLRRDALNTAATFEQLLETFQTAIAPGLVAGLDVDQIREFAIRISQAASSIGLAQNQLAEEIRSILSGTIQSRTTRIAVALGITNEDIRNARAAGKLFEFLQERFAGFAVAGEKSLGNFNVILTRIRDSTLLVLQQGGLQFFERLKLLLGDIFKSITEADPLTGKINPSPQLVAAVAAVAVGLTAAVDEADRLRNALGFDDTLALFVGLGNTLAAVAKIVGRVVQGVIEGLTDVSGAIRIVFNVVEQLTGIDLFNNTTLQESVAAIARLVTIVFSLGSALAIVKSLFFLGTIKSFVQGLIAVREEAGVVTRSLSLLSKSIAIVVVALSALELGRYFFDNFRVVQEGAAKMLAFLEKVAIHIRTAFVVAFFAIKNAGESTFTAIKKVAASSLETIASLLEDYSQLPLGDSSIRFANAAKDARQQAKLLREEIALSGTVAGETFSQIEKLLNFQRPRAFNKAKGANTEVDKFTDRVNFLGSDFLDAKTRRLDSKQIEALTSKTKKLIDDLRKSPDQVLQAFAGQLDTFLKQALIDAANQSTAVRIDVILDGLDDSSKEIDNRLNRQLADIQKEFAGKATKGKSFVDFVGEDLTKLQAKLREVGGDLFGALDPAQAVKPLGEALSELPGIVSRARDPLSANASVVRELEDSLERIQAAFRSGLGTVGLEGGIRAQREVVFDVLAEFQSKTKTLSIEEKQLLTEQNDIRAERAGIDGKLFKLEQAHQKLIEQGVESGLRIQNTQRQLGQSDTAIAQGKAAIASALQAFDQEALAASKEKLSLEQRQNDLLRERLASEIRIGNAITEGQSPEIAAEILRTVTRILSLKGQEAGIEQNLASLREDKLIVEQQINQQLALRLGLLARQENFVLGRELQVASVSLQNDQEAELLRLRGDFETRNLAARQAETRLLQVQIEQANELRDLKDQALQATIAEQQAKLESLRTQAALTQDVAQQALLMQQIADQNFAVVELQKQQVLTGELNNIVRQQEQVLVDELLRKTALAMAAVNDPISEGIAQGLEDLDVRLSDTASKFQLTFRTIQDAATGFADVISGTIVDAFDPTTKADLRERFRLFLQQIASDILQTIVRIAVVKTLISGAGFFGGFHEGGEVPGMAEGGRIKHARARGFAAGGRPDGLHRTDTVPIWAAPGEWVIRASSAAQYGAGVMDSINRGLIDPTELRGLAGVRKSSRSRSSSGRKGRGFAAGGSVSTAPAAASQGSSVSIAVVAPSEENLRRTLAGGRNAMIEFMQDNADTIKAILG